MTAEVWPKRFAPGSLKLVTSCSPRSQVSCSRLKNAFVACAAPRARRQREQWQLCMRSGSPASSQAIALQRQLPRTTPAFGAGAGRSTVWPSPNTGGKLACCGRPSVMGYQSAREAVNM